MSAQRRILTTVERTEYVTKVIRGIHRCAIFRPAFLLVVSAALSLQAQDAAKPVASQPAPETAADAQRSQPTTAAELYQRLVAVGLDKSRVFSIRDANLDRGACHISLDAGTIAFTEDVAGHVTGAFFEGEGEVLLSPPDPVERRSLALFTGGAILEESFATAYFRFDDKTFSDLQPALRPADDAQAFVSQWNETARNLSQGDALRLLVTFSRYLPMSGKASSSTSPSPEIADGRFFHARVQGQKLGAFDVFFDSTAAEPLWIGQMKMADGISYYDVWTEFSPPHVRNRSESVGGSEPGEPGESGEISLPSYRIRAQVRPPSQLDAEAWLQMEVRQGGERAVLFELSRSLRVKQVDADGASVEFIHNPSLDGTRLARRGNDIVAVVFPRPLRSGETVNLHFSYGGEVLSEAGKGLLYVGDRGTWYPNRGLQMSNYDLEFQFPAGWTLVATGKRATPSPAAPGQTEAIAHGQQMMRWVSERPIPVAGFNLGKYSRVTARAGEVTVEAYATSGVERSFPTEEDRPGRVSDPGMPSVFRRGMNTVVVPPPLPSPARNAQAVADHSARAIDFFSHRFGPYPYASLSLTQMPGILSQGWPSLVFLSSSSFLTVEEQNRLHLSQAERILNSTVIAHETAHQWWGDLVGWQSYRDQWLVEALANYSSLMFLESQDPTKFHAVLDNYRENLLTRNKEGELLADAGPVTLGTRLTSSHFPTGYETISYGRGTWLMHMLCTMMRDGARKNGPHSAEASDARAADDPFSRALRTMRQRYQGKFVSTREMLKVFEEELPPSLWYEGRKSLDWFYTGWINGTAIPRLELKDVKYIDKPSSVAVSGAIEQKESPADLVTAVPVYASVGTRTVFLGIVLADGSESTFHLSAPVGARKVVLDPYHTLLTRLR